MIWIDDTAPWMQCIITFLKDQIVLDTKVEARKLWEGPLISFYKKMIFNTRRDSGCIKGIDFDENHSRGTVLLHKVLRFVKKCDNC